jgi:hypothetical protein
MEGKARYGAFCYGFLPDLDGATGVSGQRLNTTSLTPVRAGGWRIFIARAGRDQFEGVNESINGFVAAALGCNLPAMTMNHATGPHAFDLMDESEASRKWPRMNTDQHG